MMRLLILTLVFFLYVHDAARAGFPESPFSSAYHGLVINEIYYDHDGNDKGWEFVELYNGGTEELCISDARLEFSDGKTGSTGVVWSSGAAIRMMPGDLLLVAGSEYGPKEGFLLGGALGNGPDCVTLLTGSEVIDRVGYGTLDLPDLFESAPAPDVDAGYSLSRKPDGRDTQVNSDDFVCTDPSPGRPNFFDFDIGLLPVVDGILACDGMPVDFRIVVRNSGLLDFNGLFRIDISNGQPGGSFHIEEESTLVPGGTLLLEMALPEPFSLDHPFISVLESELNSNQSNDTLLTGVSVSPGDVIISEIMYRPLEKESEWIEVHNRSVSGIDLCGWCMTDAVSSRKIIADESLPVPPGSFVILAQNPALFTMEFADCPVTAAALKGGWPSLNDCTDGKTREKLVLYNTEGRLVEAVEYGGLLGDERGRSLERFSTDACSSLEEGIWHRCPAVGRATPGRANMSDTGESPDAGQVLISPASLLLGSVENVRITGSCAISEAGFVITIFDMSGVTVRRILAERNGARVFSCGWDGKSESGKYVETGLYICVVEFLAPGGVVCRREKRCIAVSGGG